MQDKSFRFIQTHCVTTSSPLLSKKLRHRGLTNKILPEYVRGTLLTVREGADTYGLQAHELKGCYILPKL
jgi:hypothetical protein